MSLFRRFDKIFRCHAVLAVLLAAGCARADAETLEEAMQKGLAISPGLKAERSHASATNEDVASARSSFLPTVNFSYTGEHQAYRDERNRNSRRGYDHRLRLDMEQRLFQGLAGVNRLNEAHERSAAGLERLSGVQQDLILDVAEAYLSVVRDRSLLAQMSRYEDAVRREYQAAVGRQRIGDASRTDVEQAAARLADARGAVAQVRGDLDASIVSYQRLTGTPPGKLHWPKIPGGLTPATVAAAIESALANNPEVRARTADAWAAKYASRAALGDMLPSVTLHGSYENGFDGNLGNMDDEDVRVGVRVAMPLFTGGRNSSNLRRARDIADQNFFELEDIRKIVEASVVRAKRQRDAALQRAGAAEQSIAANRRALKGLEIEYESGQRTLLDVLNGQRELANSQVEQTNARFDALWTEFVLLAAAGLLEPEHFGLEGEAPPEVVRIVPLFSPVHLRLNTEG